MQQCTSSCKHPRKGRASQYTKKSGRYLEGIFNCRNSQIMIRLLKLVICNKLFNLQPQTKYDLIQNHFHNSKQTSQSEQWMYSPQGLKVAIPTSFELKYPTLDVSFPDIRCKSLPAQCENQCSRILTNSNQSLFSGRINYNKIFLERQVLIYLS